MRPSFVGTAIAAAILLGIGSAPAGAAPRAESAPIDILLAIDGTASMRSSIAQAKQDGERLAEQLQGVSSNVQFGVAVFRDFRNPAGDYELLQSLTREVTSFRTALQRVQAVSNPDPANSTSESYSLLFRKTYSDSSIQWRPGARRVVVVIGDAEPYGAGTTGLAGCRSKAADPYGLKPADELARMMSAGVVLLLVRQVSSETTADLGCYETLADQAAFGSAARDGGGRSDLVSPIVALTKQIFAPLNLRPSTRAVRSGGAVKYVLTLNNRSSSTMRVTWLRARLPRSLKYDSSDSSPRPKRRLTSNYAFFVWHLNRTVAPGKSIVIKFSARPAKSGRYRVTARGIARLSELTIDVDTRAAELVARR